MSDPHDRSNSCGEILMRLNINGCSCGTDGPRMAGFSSGVNSSQAIRLSTEQAKENESYFLNNIK